MFDKDKEKDGIFSYNSNVRDSTAFKVLGIEFVVIVVIVAVALFLLNYFLIFPLGILNPKLFGWLPTKQNVLKVNKTSLTKTTANPSPTITIDESIIPEVGAVSDVPSTQLTINDKEGLINLLQNWQVFGRTYRNVSKIFSSKPLRRVIFHLTDKEQPGYQFKNNKGVIYMSSSLSEKTPGIFDVYVYLDKDLITNTKVLPDSIFQNEGLRTVYYLISPINPAQQASINTQTENVFSDITRNLTNSNKSFFHIEKISEK